MNKTIISLSLFIVVISQNLNSQPIQPIAKSNSSLTNNGFYFLTPYKIERVGGLPPSTEFILNGNGDLIWYSYKFKWVRIHEKSLMSYWSDNKFYIIDSTFKLIDSVACVNNTETDFHDFTILPDGNYLLIGAETETQDYSKKRLFFEGKKLGSKTTKVKFNCIQELNSKKELVFNWSSKGIYVPEDMNSFYLTDTNYIDLTHFNSVDKDEKGNYLVSVRNFDEVIKINSVDGSIIWRMGGKKNQLTVLNDSLHFFAQHDAKYIKGKGFTLFDNGHNYDSLKHPARALEYGVNDSAKTATLIWGYTNPDKIYSLGNGNVQRFENGTTLINYGKIADTFTNITFQVVDGTKKTILTVLFPQAMGTYKTTFYSKIPFTLHLPLVKAVYRNGENYLSTEKKYKHYLWSTGEKNSEIKFTKSGKYFVFVSDDGISFTRSAVKQLSLKSFSKK